MKVFQKMICFLLIAAMMVGLTDAAIAEAKQANDGVTTYESTADNMTDNSDQLNSMAVENADSFSDTEYPYADLEEPATIEGFDVDFKDNVEFLPEQTDYDIVPAPAASISGSGNTSEDADVKALSINNTNIKNYLPGTKMMKFADESFVPEKNKIYIDGDSQSSFKVIDDADELSGRVEAAVVKPGVDEVFESVYIPSQEVALTKGNITDLENGVELVDDMHSFAIGNANENLLPDPDPGRSFQEFQIPSIKIYPFDGEKEEPKGEEEGEDPTPTPNPEDRDAYGQESTESMACSIRIKGGRIRIYEPTLVAESSWNGNFKLGFKSLKVESSVTVEGTLDFSKRSCMRLYGYGVDFDSGTEIAGRRIAAHLGIGIYAVIGIEGKITLSAKIEQAGTIEGGIKGNFWAIALGAPAATPYGSYAKDRFDVTIELDAKIHAYAEVGPQLTLDILDFNLLTVQFWVGLDGNAVVHGGASVGDSGGSIALQMDLDLDFVVLFNAWVFDYPFKYELARVDIYSKSLSFAAGGSASGSTVTEKNYSSLISLDGVDAYWDAVWGTASYYDDFNKLVPMNNAPVDITVTKKNGQVNHLTARTDTEGKFVLGAIPGGLLPSDRVMVSVNYQTTEDGVTKKYTAALAEPVNPTTPFDIHITEADAFNDRVAGSISPASPYPGQEGEQYYNGEIEIMVKDENGKVIRTKKMQVSGGNFTAKFPTQSDISGGHKVYASLKYEDETKYSNEMQADLAALKLNVGCRVDGINAKYIIEAIREQNSSLIGSQGIKVSKIEFAGTVTNLKASKPYTGIIAVTANQSENFSEQFPLTPYSIMSSHSVTITPPSVFNTNMDITQLLKTSVSTFDNLENTDPMWNKLALIRLLSFTIEYEGIKKYVSFNFLTDGETITTGHVNPIDQILIDKIDSRINPVELVFSVGSSQMHVNGSMMPIDGSSNTSVMQVNGKTYVPAKAAIEALGGTYSSTRAGKVTLKLNNSTVVAAGNSKGIKVNGSTKTLGTAPFVTKDGILMIPSVMLSDYFGYKVSWNSKNKSLTITQPQVISGKTTSGKTTTGKITSGQTTSGKTATENNNISMKEETPWTGVWDSTYGTLLLVQNKTKVTGTYGSWEDNNTITGTIKNGKLTGTFHENGDKGEFIFTLKEDESDDFGTAKAVWGGVWNTDLGAMVLEQKSSTVNGIYQPEGFLIQGNISGKEFTGMLKEEQKEGEFIFTLNEDGKTFTGKYRYDGEEEWDSVEGIKLNQ